jgi:hypothetical protein
MAHNEMGLDIRAAGPSTPEADARHAKAVAEAEAWWEAEFGPEAMPRLMAEYEQELAEYERELAEEAAAKKS